MRDLPPSWKNIPGEDLFTLVRGVTYDKSGVSSTPAAGLVAILRASNIAEGRIVTDDLIYVPAKFISQDQYLREGDILIASSSGSRTVVGKAAPASFHHRQYAFGAFCTVARPRTPEAGQWLARYTNTRMYRNYVEQHALGISINNLRSSDLKAILVPTAPLSEQGRIVAKIDSLSAESSRARDHLNHIRRLVEKYKRAVLIAGLSGDLTKKWRGLNGLKKEWTISTIGQVATIASGQTPKGIEQSLTKTGDTPWFKVSSMNEPENLKGLHASQFRLPRSAAKNLGLRIFPPGSTTFPKRGGAIATNKKRRLLVEAALDLNLMVLTATGISSDYLWWWLQNLNLGSISNGSNVPQINNGDISSLEIEIPPVAEQKEIVCRLETAFDWIERLTKEVVSVQKLVKHLDQAVLEKAFRGELVPQDPNDEPASILLERLRAENITKPEKKRRASSGKR